MDVGVDVRDLRSIQTNITPDQHYPPRFRSDQFTSHSVHSKSRHSKMEKTERSVLGDVFDHNFRSLIRRRPGERRLRRNRFIANVLSSTQYLKYVVSVPSTISVGAPSSS